VHAGVEQNAVVVKLDEPRARADVRVGIQIGDVHQAISPQRRDGTKKKEFLSSKFQAPSSREILIIKLQKAPPDLDWSLGLGIYFCG
jgi:hypothetical protein